MMCEQAKKIIHNLGLQLHPEGGFYRETYRSQQEIDLPNSVKRSVSTAIYYFLTPETFSEIHRLKNDEIFHFYTGSPVEMLQLFENGDSKIVYIGEDVISGYTPQVVVQKNVWQGARLKKGGQFALLGCTVSPGFDFEDYESGKCEELVKKYPDRKDFIEAITRY